MQELNGVSSMVPRLHGHGLIAQRAVDCGHRPVLAGRSATSGHRPRRTSAASRTGFWTWMIRPRFRRRWPTWTWC